MSWPNRRRAAWLPVTLLFAACHPAARPSTTPALPALSRLQHDVDSIVDAPAFAHAYWGVMVRSLDRGETLYARNANKLMIPASNMKIVTLAAAAARLGWDYRYETRVEGAPGPDGVIAGDLVVTGNGDPSLGDRDGASGLDEWASALKARGVVRVDGRVVADARAFADPLGSGWAWDDLAEGYSAPVTALQFDENTVHVSIVPGLRERETAAISVSPGGSDVRIVNDIVTAAAGTASTVQAWPTSEPRGIRLSGTVPLGGDAIARTLAVPDPVRFFAVEFRRALIAAGIDVRGPAVALDSGSAPQPSTTGLSRGSAPLSTLALRLMKSSQNLYAETLLRTLAAHAGARATADEGKAIVQNTIGSWGLPAGDVIVADGSGLSRYNLITPNALLTILQHVYGDSLLREPFVASLPIAGRDGSLRNRMKGTAADGNARAKTGSMTGVRSVSGYVRSADGEALAFAILANNYDTTAEAVESAADAIIVRLASFARQVH